MRVSIGLVGTQLPRVSFVLLLLFSVTSAHAQDPYALTPLPRSGDKVQWYVVQPGDTLSDLTQRFLGTSTLWRENYRLNPQVRDPDLLTPGARIRLITLRPPQGREAEVTQLARKVENQLFPDRIERSNVGDRLKEKDGIRTYEDASAELTFDNESQLLVGENSLIFLQQVDRDLVGVRRESIEIQRGQAEVSTRPARAGSNEIEIIIGSTRARPRPGASGTSQTRARKPEGSEGAKVMVYGGSSEVEAAGAKVEVPKGMGTSVPESGPPAPPEKLLPAPTLTKPGSNSEWAYSNPLFAWRAVQAAASYTVEICADKACTGLVARTTELTEPQWAPERLPEGEHFWRVTAVSESGLDGFPSRARPFRLLVPEPDVAPPMVAIVLEGPGEVTGGRAALGPGAGLRPESRDDASGVAEVRYRWDGGAWEVWKDGALRPPSVASATLEIQAEDNRGRVSPVWSVAIESHADRPSAPEVSWEGP